MYELLDLVSRLDNVEVKTLLYIYDQLCYLDDQSDESVILILQELICSFETIENCEIVQSIVNTILPQNIPDARNCFQNTLMKEPSSCEEENVVDSVYEYAVKSQKHLIEVRESIAQSIKTREKSSV